MMIILLLLLILNICFSISILKIVSVLEDLLLEVEREQRRIDKSLWRKK